MLDIGIVHYRIRAGGGGFDARWHSTRLGIKEVGTGVAQGNTSNGFVGSFVITYFNPDGAEAGTFDLKIEKNGAVYDLSYSQHGKTLLLGVGMETEDGLAAGYRKIE